MKKQIVSLAALLLITSTAFLFTSCSKSLKDGIVGVWTDDEALYCFTADGKSYMASQEDGKFQVEAPSDYSVEGNKVTMDGIEVEGGINGNELTLKNDTFTLKLKRVLDVTEAELKAAFEVK